MKKYPKNRKPSGYSICNICGKPFKARGLGTHKREAHKMVVRMVDYYSNDTNITTVNEKLTLLHGTSVYQKKTLKQLSKNYKAEQYQEETLPIKETSSNQVKKTRLYTDMDIWILYARRSLVFYSMHYPPHIMKWRLIKDFEDRFKCNFDDVEKDNPRIS
ncbi:MAG TPA: hypothetical protein VJ954_07105, partial [Ignavibacteriaceae bacterium]|nr:hypothetical protein [Ignavibacteriaceae bacterium]